MRRSEAATQRLRQFHLCREVVRRDLGLLPAESTGAAYEEILADRTPKRIDTQEGNRGVVESRIRLQAAGPTRGTPMIALASVFSAPLGRNRASGPERTDNA